MPKAGEGASRATHSARRCFATPNGTVCGTFRFSIATTRTKGTTEP
jgi:hypothetical protein